MYALTICQPWAFAVMEGIKRFENRVWDTSYRGPLVIHAGKSRKWLGGLDDLRSLGYLCYEEDLRFGEILGVVDLVACHKRADMHTDDPFAEGPFCWEVLRPRKLFEPIPYRGRQGLFQIPDELLEDKQFDHVRCCRKCGCADLRACPGGCYWVADDLCSRCEGK